jgi:hypothetical protein
MQENKEEGQAVKSKEIARSDQKIEVIWTTYPKEKRRRMRFPIHSKWVKWSEKG